MGHSICALIVAGPVDTGRAAAVGLHARLVHDDITVFPIDHYYSAYWAARRGTGAELDLPDDLPVVFPREDVLLDLVREVTGTDEPRFAIVETQYHGGAGAQWGVAFAAERRLTAGSASINAALAAIGVRRSDSADEFDVIGLGTFRSPPDHLERYVELCDELGV